MALTACTGRSELSLPLPSTGDDSRSSEVIAIEQAASGLYRFEGTAWNGTVGEVLDDGSLNNPAQALDGVTTAPGRLGRAAQLDGVDDAIEIPAVPGFDLATGFTFAFWFKPASGLPDGNLWSKQYLLDFNGLEIVLDPQTGWLELSLAAGGADTVATYDPGSGQQFLFATEFNGDVYFGLRSVGARAVQGCDPTGGGDANECDHASDFWDAWTSVSADDVRAMTGWRGKLYAGLDAGVEGNGGLWVCKPGVAGDIERCDDDNDWSHVLTLPRDRDITALAVHRGHLYFTTRNADGDVWVCHDPSLGGDVDECDDAADFSVSLTNGVGASSTRLAELHGTLYAALGSSVQIHHCVPATAGDPELCDEADWVQSYIGGQAEVWGFNVYRGRLYAAMRGPGDILVCLAERGGAAHLCDDESDWVVSRASTTSMVQTLTSRRGLLYAGLGTSVGEGDVFVCDPGSAGALSVCDAPEDWTLAFDNSEDEAHTFITHRGISYVGTCCSTLLQRLGDAVWLRSTTRAFSASWHHVAVTSDGANLRLFVNGSEEATASMGFTPFDNALPMQVGRSIGNRSRRRSHGAFAGLVDELHFHDRALSSAEIAELAR